VSYLEDIVLGVEETNDRGAPEVTISIKGLTMLKDGLICGRCLADLRPLGAFPEKCPDCGFKVKELQQQQMIEDVKKTVKVGSRVSLQDEIDALGVWTPSQGDNLHL